MNSDSKHQVKTLRDRLRRATENEILNAAEQVLAEVGLDSASMHVIAERAGIAVGTIYNYFNDREALLAALFHARRSDLQERMEACVKANAGLPFRKQLTGFVRTVFDEFDAHRPFFRVVMEIEHLRHHALIMASPEQPAPVMKQIAERAKKMIQRGVREGLLKPENSEYYSGVLTGILRGLFFQNVQREGFSFVELTDFAVAVFLHGVSVHT